MSAAAEVSVALGKGRGPPWGTAGRGAVVARPAGRLGGERNQEIASRQQEMEDSMTTYRQMTLALVAASLISVGLVSAVWAGEPRSKVITEADIQARIDRRVDNEAQDRQAIQDLLRRPDVRRIAGSAGLDIKRASAAAGVLSGPELKEIAARAREIDAGAGGSEKVTISVTTIIIILLLIIILAD